MVDIFGFNCPKPPYAYEKGCLKKTDNWHEVPKKDWDKYFIYHECDGGNGARFYDRKVRPEYAGIPEEELEALARQR